MTTITGLVLPGATVTTDTPTFLASTTGNAPTAYEVRVYSLAQYTAAGFDPATSTVTYYSGIVPIAVGGNASGTIFTDLANGGTYRIYMRVAEGSPTAYIWSTWGAASSFKTFTVSIPIPTPGIMIPANGSTVSTSRPFLDALISSPMNGNVPMRRRWQIATDVGFTTGLVEVVEQFYSVIPSGSVAFPSLPSRLPQGTYLMRCRLEDIWGQIGGWSSTQGFIVSHQPSVGSQSPVSGTTVPWNGGTVTFGWTFSDIDTADFQTKYQILVWQTALPGTTTIATGDIANAVVAGQTSFTHTMTLPSGYKDVQLSWKVQVTDQDNIPSNYSPVQTFFARDVPTVAITSPATGSSISTPVPTFIWSFAASGGRTQAQYRVTITDQSTGVTVLNTGYVASAATSFTPSSSVITIGPSYQVRVDVIDSAGLTATAVSTFTASFTPPNAPTFTVDGVNMPVNGGVVVNWAGSVPNAGAQAWRVYRRNVGATTWTLIRELPITTFGFTDYTCPSSTSVQYSVAQVALDPTFSVPVESVYVSANFTGTCDDYLIVVPDDPTLNITLDNVTSESFSDEYEQGTLNLLNRGRRFELGTRLGFTGSLKAQLYDSTSITARQKKRQIDLIRASGLVCYLRNPFGDVWSISVMNAGYDRVAGVGTREFCSVSIDYSEIEVS